MLFWFVFHMIQMT